MKGYILRQVFKAGAAAAALSMAGGAMAAPIPATPVAARPTAPAGPMPVAPSSVTVVTPANTGISAPTIAGSGQAASVFNPNTPAALRPLTSPGGTVFPGTVVPGVVNGAISGIDTGVFLPGNPTGLNSLGGIFNPATVFNSAPGNVIVTGGAQTAGAAAGGVTAASSVRGGTQTAGASIGNVTVASSTPAGVRAPGAPVIVTGGSGSTVVLPASGTSPGSVIVTGGQQ